MELNLTRRGPSGGNFIAGARPTSRTRVADGALKNHQAQGANPRRLRSRPERAKKMEQARRLIREASYPSPQVLRSVALQLASRWNSTVA